MIPLAIPPVTVPACNKFPTVKAPAPTRAAVAAAKTGNAAVAAGASTTSPAPRETAVNVVAKNVSYSLFKILQFQKKTNAEEFQICR